MEANGEGGGGEGGIIKKLFNMSFVFKKTPSISLSYKLS